MYIRELNARELRFIKHYYPDTADMVKVFTDNEYNDEGYSVSVRYVKVMDANGDEILPLKETADECRENWDAFNIPHSDDDYGDSFNEPVENFGLVFPGDKRIQTLENA